MSCRKMVLGLVVSGLVTALTAGMAFAQTGTGGATAGTGGGRQGRGNFIENIKQQLGVTDDAEWSVLQPKLQKVLDLSRELRSSSFGGFGGRGGRGGRGGEGGDNAAFAQQQPTTDIAEKTTALRTTLDNKDADAKDIAQKLADVRAAREQVKTDLAAAQKDLKELLTTRQEARLVLMGLLD